MLSPVLKYTWPTTGELGAEARFWTLALRSSFFCRSIAARYFGMDVHPHPRNRRPDALGASGTGSSVGEVKCRSGQRRLTGEWCGERDADLGVGDVVDLSFDDTAGRVDHSDRGVSAQGVV